jgi:hypothetical protein
MKAFTLHNVDDELYKRLVLEAEEKGWSLNVVAKNKLSEAYGLGGAKKKRDLSWMRGLWTKEEGEKFDKLIEEEFEQIDEEDWK